jgi:hypothetical protein
MNTKHCTECNITKDISEFHWRQETAKNGSVYRWPETYCKPCGNKKSKEVRRKLAAKRDKNYRYSYAKSMATTQRKREWILSKEQWLQLINAGCYYCEANLLEMTRGSGLDRIDNSRGYTLDNVLPCCTDCNALRGARLTVEETKAAMQVIIELRKPKLRIIK